MRDGEGHNDSGAAPVGDTERDAWLREALRHAPDASAAPPPALREAILAQARAVAAAAAGAGRATASSRPRQRSFADFWAWLARPPVASGFAGLMAATLVGLMWWDQPMDLAQPRPASPAAERLESAPAAMAPTRSPARDRLTAQRPAPVPQASAPGTATPPTPIRKDVDALSQSQSRADAPWAFPPADPATVAETARPREQLRAKQDARSAEGASNRATSPASGDGGSAAPPRPFTAPKPIQVEPGAGASASVEAEPGAGATAAAQAASAAPAGPRARSEPAPPAVAPTSPAPLRDRQGMAAEPDARTADPGRSPAPAAAEVEKRGERPALARREAAAPMQQESRRTTARDAAALFASLSAETSRWSRRMAGGAPAPLDAATRRWLDEVEAATRARWTAAPLESAAPIDSSSPLGSSAPLAAASPTRAGASMVLLFDGRPAAVLSLAGSAVLYEWRVDGQAVRGRAALSPAEAARLASTLPR
jgi:hypothetical protein